MLRRDVSGFFSDNNKNMARTKLFRDRFFHDESQSLITEPSKRMKTNQVRHTFVITYILYIVWKKIVFVM